MTTPRAQWKAHLVETAMQIPQLKEILRYSRSSDFENWQRVLLFAAFKKNDSLTTEQTLELAKEVELEERQVDAWFRARQKDDTKKKINAVHFTSFSLKGPPPTKKEKEDLALKNNVKRKKFTFDPTQTAILNGFFDQNANPSKKDKKELRKKLGNVEEKQITYWFLNRRKRSQTFQEFYNQGKEEQDATNDEKPTQPHSRSAFPIRVRNILSKEFEKSSKLNSENLKRILEMTGLTKKQVQLWFYNARTREAKKNVNQPEAEKKKYRITFECIEDEDGNVTINVPADAFKEGTKVTIQYGNTTLHLNHRRKKKPEIGDSGDDEEEHQAPEFETWSEYSKENAKRSEKSPISSEYEDTDDEEETAATSEAFGTPKVTSTQLRRSRRNQRIKTPDQSDANAHFDINPLSRSPSHSPAPKRRREREDSNTQSDGTEMTLEPMDIDFDDFNHGISPPARSLQYSPEQENTGIGRTSSEGTPDADGMDLDDFNHGSPPVSQLHRVSPKPQHGQEDANTSTVPPTEMDVVFDGFNDPTSMAPLAVSSIPKPTDIQKKQSKEKDKKKKTPDDSSKAGTSGIDWEGERLARNQERIRREERFRREEQTRREEVARQQLLQDVEELWMNYIQPAKELDMSRSSASLFLSR